MASATADPGDPSASGDASQAVGEVPAVLRGDTWLTHHRDDLMPYWDMPAALGTPIGNFPSFRGRNGELLPDQTNRGLSTLARQVYGYCVAFMLTGQDRFLTYAKAGLDWIEAHAKDPANRGYFGDLDVNGNPLNPAARKDLFDLDNLGFAYGMYYNVTRDPAAEKELLAVRDLIFNTYYDRVNHRMNDAMSADLKTPVDVGRNGEDITSLLEPVAAISLPYASILSDPVRRDQFRGDLRELLTDLVANHKNTEAGDPSQRFWFWGRAKKRTLDAAETDFGHNIVSYELLFDADNVLPDRPWDNLATDRDTLLARAWDDEASRWNQGIDIVDPLLPSDLDAGQVVKDAGWWPHDEADETLASLDMADGFQRADQLARSAQTFLDVFVDRDPAYPARETFARVTRDGVDQDLRKSFLGKNMYHNSEHALVMYLHGQAMEGTPARLYYAFPADQALTAVARPYWFNATTESRTVTGDVPSLPGHQLVQVDFSGIGGPTSEPYPAPDDTVPPTTNAVVTPAANEAGWNNQPVTLDLTATDDLVGVKEIHVLLDDQSGLTRDRAVIDPGDHATVTLDAEGDYDVSYFAVDLLGNAEPVHTMRIRVDRTAPSVTGLPAQGCSLWPPNGRMVTIAQVAAADAFSGVADVDVQVTADEPLADDVAVDGGTVQVRAFRDDEGDGRTYTVTATAVDTAGNTTVAQGSCVVPHDLRGAQR